MSNTDKLQPKFTIEQMRQALARFCNGDYRMSIPVLEDDDDMILSYAISQLEQAQATVETLKEGLSAVISEKNIEVSKLTDDCEAYKAEAKKYLAESEQLKVYNHNLITSLEKFDSLMDFSELLNVGEEFRFENREEVNEAMGFARQVLSEVKGNVADS